MSGYMTDTGRTANFLNFAFDGGTILTVTQPYHLRLMTAMGTGAQINTNGSNGSEMTTEYGYTAGNTAGNSLGSSAPFGSFSATAPSGSNANAVSWSATGSWPPIVGIEIWDSASGTPLRWLVGTLTSEVTGVVTGDSVQFSAASITAGAQAW